MRALGGAAIAFAGLLLVPGTLQAQDAAGAWRALTRADVDAAHALLAQDHPGAAEEVGDVAFRRTLAAAHAQALERAARVTSYGGYAATMHGFANAMGDRHIWSHALVAPATVDWAGLLFARRGSAWIVAEEDPAPEEPLLAGAHLISCDGIPADALAQQRLGGFRAIWSIPAQQIAAAPFLLVDDGNPFLVRPVRCVFDQSGDRREIALRWRAVDRTELAGRIDQVLPRGAAGFGVRRSGAGYWVALESLSDQARSVVTAVRAQAAQIRQAPYVVLDMRGNGGGNSSYGDAILEALFGAQALRGGETRTIGCNTVWRASPRNIAVLDEIRRGATELGPAASRWWQGQYSRARQAAAAGRALSGPPTCGRSTANEGERRRPPDSLFRGRLIVLTDHVCFSSCVLVTDRFRRLGALHAGEATDAMTRYFEVREERMPSGLSMFSTLQALSPSSPSQIGPFVPDHAYEGDIGDTPALERWIADLAARGDEE